MSTIGDVIADFHMHTVASVHAYSTIDEMARAAAQKGLKAIAITEHGIGAKDAPRLSYFGNMCVLPPYMYGVRVFMGVEANIMQHDGTLDMPESTLKRMDYVIASYHSACVKSGTFEEHTRSYLELAENPYVDLVGHSGTLAFAYDYAKVIPVFGRMGKAVEINAHSVESGRASRQSCSEIALLCMKHSVPVLVNSDAHCLFDVGRCGDALDMLRDIGFPNELIMNNDEVRLQAYIAALCARKQSLR